jgi:MFS family permease
VASERAVLVTAALGTMLMPLNSTMIAVALPDIVDDLGVSLASTAWLVSGYLIAQASLQPLAGKLATNSGGDPSSWRGLPLSRWRRWVPLSHRASPC